MTPCRPHRARSADGSGSGTAASFSRSAASSAPPRGRSPLRLADEGRSPSAEADHVHLDAGLAVRPPLADDPVAGEPARGREAAGVGPGGLLEHVAHMLLPPRPLYYMLVVVQGVRSIASTEPPCTVNLADAHTARPTRGSRAARRSRSRPAAGGCRRGRSSTASRAAPSTAQPDRVNRGDRPTSDRCRRWSEA